MIPSRLQPDVGRGKAFAPAVIASGAKQSRVILPHRACQRETASGCTLALTRATPSLRASVLNAVKELRSNLASYNHTACQRETASGCALALTRATPSLRAERSNLASYYHTAPASARLLRAAPSQCHAPTPAHAARPAESAPAPCGPCGPCSTCHLSEALRARGPRRPHPAPQGRPGRRRASVG